ncbi:MAG: hypothetical protein WBN18_16515 [Flavobacteriaceae bacterium]
MAKKHHLHCVSIYLPMDMEGLEQNRHLAQARLKSCIKQTGKALEAREMSKQDIKEYLLPVESLLSKIELWRNPSMGLAIFLDPEEGMRYYEIPIAFEELAVVNSHFYLSPLLPLYHNDGDYYLLELSRDYVKLYEASRYHFEDVYVEDFAPGRLEEAVGFDFRPKMLQFRSGQNVFGAGSFHGRGEGKDDDKKELITFLRAVDQGVKKVVAHKKAPLVLACVDYLYDLYREASTYPEIFGSNVGGDPEFKNKKSLHRESWQVVETHFMGIKAEKIEQVKELYHTQKTSYELEAIVPAAWQGKIDTLLVDKSNEVYGTFDTETNEVKVSKNPGMSNTSLTHMAALATFSKGGQVYMLPPEEMPIKGSPLNALFRF